MSTWGERARLAAGTCLGLGLSPVAPGTMGTLLGVAGYAALVLWVPEAWHTPSIVAGLGLVSWANNALTPWAQRRWNDKDPSNFVLDEVAGYWLTVLLFRGGPHLAVTLALTFLVVRIIDIAKVPPAKRLEKIPGGWGILLDDYLSGIYAASVLHLVRYWRPGLFD